MPVPGASEERGKEEFTSHSAKDLNSFKAKMLDILFNDGVPGRYSTYEDSSDDPFSSGVNGDAKGHSDQQTSHFKGAQYEALT